VHFQGERFRLDRQDRDPAAPDRLCPRADAEPRVVQGCYHDRGYCLGRLSCLHCCCHQEHSDGYPALQDEALLRRGVVLPVRSDCSDAEPPHLDQAGWFHFRGAELLQDAEHYYSPGDSYQRMRAGYLPLRQADSCRQLPDGCSPPPADCFRGPRVRCRYRDDSQSLRVVYCSLRAGCSLAGSLLLAGSPLLRVDLANPHSRHRIHLLRPSDHVRLCSEFQPDSLAPRELFLSAEVPWLA
jgi:hypothetical protein